MKTDITVSPEHQEIFMDCCKALSIQYEPLFTVSETLIFRVTHDCADLYYLGRYMGLKIGQKIITETFK